MWGITEIWKFSSPWQLYDEARTEVRFLNQCPTLQAIFPLATGGKWKETVPQIPFGRSPPVATPLRQQQIQFEAKQTETETFFFIYQPIAFKSTAPPMQQQQTEEQRKRTRGRKRRESNRKREIGSEGVLKLSRLFDALHTTSFLIKPWSTKLVLSK